MTIEKAVDPTIPPAQREVLSTRPQRAQRKVTLDDMVRMDIENLVAIPAFRRFCFTIFRDCGMYSGNFHSVDAILSYAEGRRSLGLDILGRLVDASSDAHIAILTEVQPYQEKQNGRRNSYNRNDLDRDADDGNDVDDNGNDD
jgi:hypothetical protein